mmetsp:Transcript_32830/g.49625  ORF Transcript_32830/g.49625 Transcript_32830/m.49625 type:complete len:138 (+) Transcript_32830:3-416(+)
MTQCPHLDFEFAPMHTFTVGDAVRSFSTEEYGDKDGAYFAGKWHLGSFYKDAARYGGVVSSPLSHGGFTKMNATVEVAPTATSNCMCKAEWNDLCDFGHNHEPTGCRPEGECCFNYWWDDPLGNFIFLIFFLEISLW